MLFRVGAASQSFEITNCDLKRAQVRGITKTDEALKETGIVSEMSEKPIVTTLCGSTRFFDAFALADMHLSLQGRIVISLGMFGHSDHPRGARFLTSDGDESTAEKQLIDQLHFRKIDLSDGIYVVNPGGYIGSSTQREIAYARETNKTIEFMFPEPTEAD